MRIESTVAKRALMRQGIVVVVLLAFGTWFGWDGWVGYPTKNMNEAKGNFPVVPAGDVPQYGAVTAESAKDFQSQIGVDPARQITLTNLTRTWNKPAYLGAADAAGATSPGSPRVAFFVGTYGWAKATLAGDGVTHIEWRDADKDYSAIAVQKLLASLLAVGAMIPLGILLSYMSGKYILDDEGLTLPGNRRVLYNQMTAIELADLQKRGIVRLTYQNDKGQQAVAVLDEEKIAKFEEIVLNICEKKGWQDELAEAAAAIESPPQKPPQG